MKKCISVLLSVMAFAFSLILPADAVQSEKEYFDDGSYIIISDNFVGDDTEEGDSWWDNVSGEESSPESGESKISRFLKGIIEIIKKIILFLKNAETVTKTKYVSYFSSEGKLLWTATMTAGFSYNGKNSVCESVKTGCRIYDSDWNILSKECSKSGSSATAYFKFRQNKLGVPLKVIEKTVTMSCDKDGNIK